VGFRREFQEHQSRSAKPSSTELAKRNRESALNQAIMFYEERPAVLPEIGAWVEKTPIPRLVVVDGGVVFSVELVIEEA
jgi:hypothetical protein